MKQPLITFKILRKEYLNAIAECCKIIPLDRWVHRPTTIGLTSHKTKYGRAYSTGSIELNKCFIGSQAYTQMRKTLRHEIAHLSCGIARGHDKIFKLYNKKFGGTCEVPKHETEELKHKIGFKWFVLAHLINGESIPLFAAHKRTKKYLQYETSQSISKFKGVLIKRFEYVNYDQYTKKTNSLTGDVSC